MNNLAEWLGKVDELSKTYDAGIYQAQILPGGDNLDSDLPAIIYLVNDNIRDVAEAIWEEEIKKQTA